MRSNKNKFILLQKVTEIDGLLHFINNSIQQQQYTLIANFFETATKEYKALQQQRQQTIYTLQEKANSSNKKNKQTFHMAKQQQQQQKQNK